jgi:hypothetical protein
MPSSYTTSLRLTLPATGELAGQWGQTVNTGITELLDAAVAGTTTISTWGGPGVAYTLSNNSGTADEARRMFIVATGTPGEAKNVICPAVSKMYVFRNDTTGGFALTLKTSGGTGIAVPAGQYKLLYCDGTNVVEAVNSLGPVASLSASQAVFTDASKNLVSNAITGTGNVVMSTSPTLVTPVLGAATATSLNGLTVSSTTGTLTLANGSTLATSGANALTLTTTGATNVTLPTSGTLATTGGTVASFSAGSTGFTPSTATTGAVTLAGTLATTNGGTGLTSFTANGVVYASSTSALATGSALTFDGTNFGIGTGGNALNQQSVVYKSGVNAVYHQIANGSTGLNAANGVRLGVSSGGTGEIYSPTALISYIDNSEQMRLTSTGLGIGTSSPAQLFHARKDQAAYTWARVDNQSSSASAYSGWMLGAFGNSWGMAIGSSAANSNALTWVLDAGGANSEKMRLDASGNLTLASGDATIYGITVGRGAGAVATNTAVGYQAGYSNTTGTRNLFQGYQAAYYNTTASENTAVGYQALYSQTTAGTGSNTALGHQAGYTTNGFYNTFIGYKSGQVSTGNENTFVGHGSGSAITTGAKNTVLGIFTGNQGGLDIRNASNYIVLSDGDGNPRLYMDGSGNAFFTGSYVSFNNNGYIRNDQTNSLALQAGSSSTLGWQVRNNGNSVSMLSMSGSTGSSLALEGATPTTGTGITFPATQSASSDANTLDDYEEGTWTPALVGTSSVTYDNQVGRYTKVGRLVTIQMLIQPASVTYTSSTAQLKISGLPFTPVAISYDNANSWGAVSAQNLAFSGTGNDQNATTTTVTSFVTSTPELKFVAVGQSTRGFVNNSAFPAGAVIETTITYFV